MAVSMCKECRGKISTNTEICPHCGNKISQESFNPENICKINGVEYDLTPLMDDILNEEIHMDMNRFIPFINFLQEFTDCMSIATLYIQIRDDGGKVPKEFNGSTVAEMEEEARLHRATRPKCPTCGSTNLREIGFGERSLSISLFGLRSKKFNKTFECNNCGYTW